MVKLIITGGPHSTATVSAGLGFAAAGLHFAVFLGFATAFTSLIPLIGAVAVWLPVTAFVFLKGAVAKSIALLLWNALVVSMTDNILKPYLIGEKAEIPISLLFFGILGGLQVYGVVGILIGPLMIASVLSFAAIYRDLMKRPDSEKTRASDSAPS